MSDSVSFDRAADRYDETRRLTPEASRATVDLLGSELRGRRPCLEIGVGTGLIALPLHEVGVGMVGSRPFRGDAAEAGGEVGWASGVPGPPRRRDEVAVPRCGLRWSDRPPRAASDPAVAGRRRRARPRRSTGWRAAPEHRYRRRAVAGAAGAARGRRRTGHAPRGPDGSGSCVAGRDARAARRPVPRAATRMGAERLHARAVLRGGRGAGVLLDVEGPGGSTDRRHRHDPRLGARSASASLDAVLEPRYPMVWRAYDVPA